MPDHGTVFWDQYWSGQSATLTAASMTQILDCIKADYLRGILPQTGRTLEVGAGSARLSCILAAGGYETVCLDYSTPAVRAGRLNYAQAKLTGNFLIGEGSRLPLQTDSMDVVLSTGLLEHFEDPSLIVREMVRVLKPGGLFYSDIVPKKFSLFRSLDWIGRVKRRLLFETGPAHQMYERGFTEQEIVDLLRGAGLGVVHVFPAGVVPPYLPLAYRWERLRLAQVGFVARTARFWRWFDGTVIAAWLGFYYFAWGKKPAAGIVGGSDEPR